jgi:hypothetical protein
VRSRPPFGVSEERLAERERGVRAIGAEAVHQEHCGAVRIELRGDGVTITPFLGGQTFRSRAR